MKSTSIKVLAGLMLLTVAASAQFPRYTIPPPQPPNVNVTPVGLRQSGIYNYIVIANYPAGVVQSQIVTIRQAANTLTSSNFNQVGWQTLPGALTYDVLRLPTANFTGTCTCSVTTGLSPTTIVFSDQGGSLSSYTVGSYAQQATVQIYLDNTDYAFPKLRLSLIGGTNGTTADHLAEIPGGGTLPVYCTLNDLFVKSGTSAGVYYCNPANTWNAVGGGGGGLPGGTGVVVVNSGVGSAVTLSGGATLNTTTGVVTLTGNAPTATALAASPSVCATGQKTTGISATGTAQSCTATPQKFFGTAAPGSVATNLPGDLFYDTTNFNTYGCLAPAATAAPACTSVTAGGWALLNGGGGGGAVADYKVILFANCNNATPGAGVSLGPSGVLNCDSQAPRNATNNLGGYVSITPSTAATYVTFQISLPEDWVSATNPYLRFGIASPDATNGHTVIPNIQVACYKGDGTTTDDVAPNAVHSSSTVTLNGTANRYWSTSNVQLNSTDVTGCVAGALMQITVGSTGNATSVNFYNATMTVLRSNTTQAN